MSTVAGFYKRDNDDAFALRRVSFDTAAALYDKARPTYPGQLFDDLVDIARLSKNSSALEIGSGTGKASIDLAKRIGQLVCIEPGRNLAEIAGQNLKAFPSFALSILRSRRGRHRNDFPSSLQRHHGTGSTKAFATQKQPVLSNKAGVLQS